CMARIAACLMYSGVGRFDSPKYRRSTPSMDIATSASSRMRECGTFSTEGATRIRDIVALVFAPKAVFSARWKLVPAADTQHATACYSQLSFRGLIGRAGSSLDASLRKAR